MVLARKGTYLIKPRTIPHAFYNAATEQVRVMEPLTPGDPIEGYFDEHKKSRSEPGRRYRITWHGDMISEVKASFGIGS